jgi:hypothetical protein
MPDKDEVTMNTKTPGFVFRALSIVGVSFYLLTVFLILRFKRRIRPPFSLTQIPKTWLRRPFKGELAGFTAEDGFCWLAGVPNYILSDRESYSKLVVLEDGQPLPQPHAAHDAIRRDGRGAYSHWGSVVYLSSSDNTDPSKNGRKYEVVERK